MIFVIFAKKKKKLIFQKSMIFKTHIFDVHIFIRALRRQALRQQALRRALRTRWPGLFAQAQGRALRRRGP